MRVHHLNITCRDFSIALPKLTRLYGFAICGQLSKHKYHKNNVVLGKINQHNESNTDKQYVLRQNNIIFTLSEDKKISSDTIDNVAFEVESIDECCERVIEKGGRVLERKCFISCSNNVVSREFSATDISKSRVCKCGVVCNNFIEYAVIKSPVGNVRHTLLNLHSYKGTFLPGFSSNMDFSSYDESSKDLVDKLDHIAFAIKKDSVTEYKEWYKYCLGFSRFMVNKTETSKGFVVYCKAEPRMKMVALGGHPCGSDSLYWEGTELELLQDDVKLVFAESLCEDSNDQIQMFLKNHGGDGIQHLAFHCNDIISTAEGWTNKGVDFMKPPKYYYQEIMNTLKTLEYRHVPESIINSGILIDVEIDPDEEQQDGYLYQIFTAPVLPSRTFFFEVIHRDNAKGFGAGNIAALWRAVDAHLKELEGNN